MVEIQPLGLCLDILVVKSISMALIRVQKYTFLLSLGLGQESLLLEVCAFEAFDGPIVSL